MDFLIQYIELGIIVNFLCIVPEIIIAIYLSLGIGLIEMDKYMIKIDEYKEKFNYYSFLHYFIPFYGLYLLVIQIYLVHKYFDETADSIDTIIKKLDKYKIFRRFK